MTDAELDDFIQYLDTKGEGFLLYKDMAQTRHRFLVEERKAILAEYGGEISEVLAQQQKMKLEAEKEVERVRKAQEVKSRALVVTTPLFNVLDLTSLAKTFV